MADFDVIRDRTLLFFLDHLMGKGQPRSLHDLSCQFGAKGFTKEMRQIAGGSQAGLKKFLSQFPSLFTIDGDNVLITPLTSQQNGFSSRDYTRETIEFFTDKLHTYGVAEVPLKSLFGHRSQASSEVRHVSGQNVSEFRVFLETHPSVFVVRDNYVVLKSVLDQLEQDGSNAESLKRMPEETTLDPYLMQRLVNELEETLFALSEKYSDKVSIDFLFNAIQSKESLLPWDNFVKVPTDLITFLHMNSRIFLVQSNTVSLTPERVQLLKEKRSTPTNHLETVPATNAANHESSQVASSRPSHTSTPLSDSVQSSSSSLSKNRSTPVLTFKERIRSQIIKIVSQQNKPPDSRNYNSNSIQEDISPNADSPYDSLDLQQLRPKIVVKNKECEMIVEDIMNNCTEVAFDLEGISLGPTGEVTLVQIAYVYSRDIKEPLRNQSPHIVYFDVFLNPNLIDSGLRRLLESEKIVKVSHDVRTNSVSLYHKFNITLRSVFDTQVAHLVLQQQSTGKPAYKPTKYISVFTLSTLHGGPNLNPKLKDKLHKHTRKDYKFWKNRPLTDEMLQFAMIDIFAVMTVYHTMRGQIRAEYEPLFEQLVYESIFAYIHSDQIKQIKRQRKFEMELTDLKLKLFNNDKKKIVLSNREIRLLRYIDLTDEIRNKIEGPQNVAKKLKMFESRRRNEQDLGESANGDQETNGHNGSNGHSESRVEIKLADLTDSDLDEDEEEEEVDTTEESINSSIKSSLSNDNLLKPSSGTTRCHCECHQNGSKVENRAKWEPSSTTNTTSSISQCDISTQTLSTGDIVITKIYFNDGTEQNDCSQI